MRSDADVRIKVIPLPMLDSHVFKQAVKSLGSNLTPIIKSKVMSQYILPTRLKLLPTEIRYTIIQDLVNECFENFFKHAFGTIHVAIAVRVDLIPMAVFVRSDPASKALIALARASTICRKDILYLISIRKTRLQTVVDITPSNWSTLPVTTQEYRDLVYKVIFCMSMGRVVEKAPCRGSGSMVEELNYVAGYLLATIEMYNKLGCKSTGYSRNVHWESSVSDIVADRERGTAILDEKVLGNTKTVPNVKWIGDKTRQPKLPAKK